MDKQTLVTGVLFKFVSIWLYPVLHLNDGHEYKNNNDQKERLRKF